LQLTRADSESGVSKGLGHGRRRLHSAESLALAVVMCACALPSDHRKQAIASVEAVGIESVLAAAESLRRPVEAAELYEVPKGDWPQPIQAIDPETVSVARDGVFIQLDSRYVEASGLYVTFDGAEVPEDGGGDQSFSRLWERIYWYHSVG
jgi:hypothetical protein